MFSYVDLLGQNTSSRLGRFEVDFIKGCAPLTINISEVDGLDPDLTRVYDYEYVEGNPVNPVNVTTHTYTTPGEYMIFQVIQNVTPRTDTLYIEVLEPRQPEFTVFNCEANGVFIDITDSYYDSFAIDYDDGSTSDTVTATSITHIYAAPGTYNISIQGLFDNAASNCGIATETITTINNLTEATINQVEVLDENSIEVAFNNLNENILYRLEVAQNGNTTFVEEAILDNSTTTFTLSDLDTRNNFYCFRVTAINPCDESRNLFSNTVCSIVLNVAAFNQQNDLDWDTYTGNVSTYEINKNGSSLTSINKPNTTSLVDPDVICQEIYLYQISATTSEGGISISEEQSITAISTDISPPVAGMSIGVEGSGLQLDWDGNNASLYYIRRSEAGNAFILIDSVTTPAFTDSQVAADIEYCYIVTYKDACGNESEESEGVCLEVPSQVTIYFPTAFTPNGDGLNDVFTGKSNLVNTVTLRIFNRWGELVFFSNSLDEGWDGIFNGRPVQEGTYVYRVDFTDHLNNRLTQSGSFLLLRKR